MRASGHAQQRVHLDPVHRFSRLIKVLHKSLGGLSLHIFEHYVNTIISYTTTFFYAL